MPSNTPTSRALGQMELAEREGLGSKLGVPYALQGLAAVAGRAARRSRAELPRGAGAGGPGGLVRALVSGAIWARAGPEGSWSAPRRSHYAPAGTGPLRACRPGRTVGTGMTQTEPRSCRRLPRWSLTASGWLILPRGHERRRQMASRGALPDPLHGFEGTAAIRKRSSWVALPFRRVHRWAVCRASTVAPLPRPRPCSIASVRTRPCPTSRSSSISGRYSSKAS